MDQSNSKWILDDDDVMDPNDIDQSKSSQGKSFEKKQQKSEDWQNKFLVEVDQQPENNFQFLKKDISDVGDSFSAWIQCKANTKKEEENIEDQIRNKTQQNISNHEIWESRKYGKRQELEDSRQQRNYRPKQQKYRQKRQDNRDRGFIKEEQYYKPRSYKDQYSNRDSNSDYDRNKRYNQNQGQRYQEKKQKSQNYAQNNKKKNSMQKSGIPNDWLQQENSIESFPGSPSLSIKFWSTRIQLISGRALQVPRKDFLFVPFLGGQKAPKPYFSFQTSPAKQLISQYKCQIDKFLHQKKQRNEFKIDQKAIGMKSKYENFKGFILIDVNQQIPEALQAGLSELQCMHLKDSNFKSVVIPSSFVQNPDECEPLMRRLFAYFNKDNASISEVILCIEKKEIFLELMASFTKLMLRQVNRF